MNTRHLMRASAAFLALLGIIATFAPHELLQRLGATPAAPAALLIQLAGALYLGFAVLNWMAQGNLIGGIYSRPVAIGNFGHFAVGAVALCKVALAGERATALLVITAVYVLFAAAFAYVAFVHATPFRSARQP